MDPGCGLGAAFYAVSTAPENDKLQEELRQAGATAAVQSVLDDVQVLLPTSQVDAAAARATELYAAVGLELHPGKSRAFTEGVRPQRSTVPFVDSYVCMGLTHYALQNAALDGSLGDGAAGAPLEGQADTALVDGVKLLDAQLRKLAGTGELSTRTQLALLRSYMVSVPVHRLRGLWHNSDALQAVDDQVRQVLGRLLGGALSDDQWSQANLSTKQGGLALPTVAGRQAPAYLGAWAAHAQTVAGAMGFTTADAFLVAAAPAAQHCAEAQRQLQQRGVQVEVNWEVWVGTPAKGVQRSLHRQTQEAQGAALLEAAQEEDEADIRSAGGVGQAFAVAPVPEAAMGDAHFRTSVRRRLRIAWPAGRAATCCQHRRADGTVCGHPLDPRGHHALTCEVGGGSRSTPRRAARRDSRLVATARRRGSGHGDFGPGVAAAARGQVGGRAPGRGLQVRGAAALRRRGRDLGNLGRCGARACALQA